ncbi:MAG: hypothetical protein QNJ94_02345 [Alphaproteobacteria bacterium]|nr:hypothetical protein [Alphaproteobacteria bacterium]
MGNSTNTGNAGEYLVLAELLARGHHAGLAERGNPTFDIITRHGDRYSSLRVKTSSNRTFQWTATGARPGDASLPRLNPSDETDFVALVAFNGGGPRNAEVYVVPSPVVDRALSEANEHYHRFPNQRTGGKRKRTNQRVIRLDGEDRPDNASFDFASKWAGYRDAWHLLEDGGSPTPIREDAQ